MTSWGPAWIVPVLALIASGVLIVQGMGLRGDRVTVAFNEGHGITPGDPVVSMGVRVGTVRRVRLNTPEAARSGRVLLDLELDPDASFLAREGARYWIVRPEVSLRGVRGLETLFGPKYVQVMPPPQPGPPKREFIGSDRPPAIPHPDNEVKPGLVLRLRADRRGGLSSGVPVLYRDIQVGEVLDAELSQDARAVIVTALIEPRYAPLVRDNSRFWNASGIGLDFGLIGGLSLRTESLETVLAGGIAFATPTAPGRPVESSTEFTLENEAKDAWLRWAPAIELTPAE